MEGGKNSTMEMFYYGECMKNHKISSGKIVTDGCCEFWPINDTPDSLLCSVCGCHRNFHKRTLFICSSERIEEPASAQPVVSPALPVIPPVQPVVSPAQPVVSPVQPNVRSDERKRRGKQPMVPPVLPEGPPVQSEVPPVQPEVPSDERKRRGKQPVVAPVQPEVRSDERKRRGKQPLEPPVQPEVRSEERKRRGKQPVVPPLQAEMPPVQAEEATEERKRRRRQEEDESRRPLRIVMALRAVPKPVVYDVEPLAMIPPGEEFPVYDWMKKTRVRFNDVQKERMRGFAEDLGWKMVKERSSEIDRFCDEIRVPRNTFKIWMNNHKNNNNNNNNNSSMVASTSLAPPGPADVENQDIASSSMPPAEPPEPDETYNDEDNASSPESQN
ncbi:zinc-finger homeodomain protein 7-like [Telopea speciosissima]|uniref:zinc-finger homeodomain protein 7-like n=1 Tax=Telopea speciosissima TaxID=54955 RepID=UPI001CC4DA95|nr:zinc-finger homeodomain protein 7-like [Telopea speciosissima]